MSSGIVIVLSFLGRYIVEISSVKLPAISRGHYVQVGIVVLWFLQSICSLLPIVPQALGIGIVL